MSPGCFASRAIPHALLPRGDELRMNSWRTFLQRVASILTYLQVDVTSANQTNPSSRPHMCIMRCGSCSLKPAVGRAIALSAPPSERSSQYGLYVAHLRRTTEVAF